MRLNWLRCLTTLVSSTLVSSTLASGTLFATAVATEPSAALNGERPPFALTLEQVNQWSVDADFVDKNNVSSVPLARRFIAPMTPQRAGLDQSAKVLYAPDGLGNFAGYLATQPRFNLYNFTHWSQIDLINFFGGTADLAVQIPARPWVETAHKNGVKVLGSVFMAVALYGGNADTVQELLSKDDDGRFHYADKLIQIAQFYGFDGWLINQETDLTVVKDNGNEVIKGASDPKRGKELAQTMLAFMQYLTAKAPQGMEVHWYDSMLMDGRVVWQNELNSANQMFLQDGVASSDGIFLNYWWNQSMIESSNRVAKSLNRSAYDVYVGADLWPARNAQRGFSRTKWLSQLFTNSGSKALGSIALFAPNFIYHFAGDENTPAFSRFKDDPNDHQSFYQAEQRMFSGDDLNLARNDVQGWPGMGRYLPARSTINSLPFSTNFSTGQGEVMMANGKQVRGAWTDMSQQAYLPTWQFGVIGNASVSLSYDFDHVFDGGNSLRIDGDLSQGGAIIPLYQTQLRLHSGSAMQVIIKGAGQGVSLYLETAEGQRKYFDLSRDDESSGWEVRDFSLSDYANTSIEKIGLSVKAAPDNRLQLMLGKLTLK